jgi:hypothetical protein
MSANWRRWLAYGKAKLDSTLEDLRGGVNPSRDEASAAAPHKRHRSDGSPRLSARLLKAGEDELDKREARLEAEAAGKPWLTSTSDAPTFEEAKARIEHMARETGVGPKPEEQDDGAGPSAERPMDTSSPGDEPSPPGAPSAEGESADLIDMAAQQKAADERLSAIREELGLTEEPDTT